MTPRPRANAGDLARVVASLDPRIAELNALDDKLSDLVKKVEAAMRGHLSTRVSVQLPEGDELAFGKLGGGWVLMLTTGDESVALNSVNRGERAKMFLNGHVERLLREAGGILDQQIAERFRALEAAEVILAALSSAP